MIHALLAAASPEPATLGNWIIVLLFVVPGIGTLATLLSYFATRREVAALEKRMDNHEEKMTDVERVLRSEASGGLATLHEKVNGVDRRLAEMEGKTEMININTLALGTKLDRLNDRLIS